MRCKEAIRLIRKGVVKLKARFRSRVNNPPNCMNLGFSRVPSVSNQAFVENAITITKQVKAKLNNPALAILEIPLSDAMLEVSFQISCCHGNQIPTGYNFDRYLPQRQR